MQRDLVQVRNPRIDRYVKIDRNTGRILGTKRSPGMWANVPMAVPKKVQMDRPPCVGDRKIGPNGPSIEEFGMNAQGFTAIALSLGHSHQGMADALGVNVRRVRAYASGGRPIPQVVALAVWALEWQPRVVDARRLLTA